MNIHNVDTYIQNQYNANTIRYLYYNLRVPCMDAEDHIVNRFAFTNVAFEFKRISTIDRRDLWTTLRGHQRALEVIRQYGMVSNDQLAYIERKLWECLDPYSKKRVVAMVRKITAIICMKNASKLWNPAYVWKTGANAGQTTAQILIKRAGF